MLTPEQRDLCLIYGAQSRQYSPTRHWDAAERSLRSGWDRIRGDWTLPWESVEHHVREGWERGVPGRNTGEIPAICVR